MTDLFSPETKAVFAKRRAELEAHIVSFFAAHPQAISTHTRSEYEIRSFVMHRLDWVRPIMVTKAIVRMVDSGRLVSSTPEGRTLPLFSLPRDPEEPFRVREERLRAFDRHILTKMPLPRFFHIDAKEDLRPSVRTRTGYDARVDFNRF